MRVLVSGAGGFVGSALVEALAGRHEVVALDRDCSGVRGARTIEGDIASLEVQAAAAAGGVDALIHLATIPGGASEQDPARGWHVNVDATAGLIDAVLQTSERPKVLFASSIAALGDSLPEIVDDETPLLPRMLYGAHKRMIEEWIAALTRRGAIRGLSLRLSGIVARPAAPSGMISAFMSDVFHAALANAPVVVPISPGATMWLMSVRQVAANFVHALEADLPAAEPHALNLPAIRTSMAELAAEIARQVGCDPALVRYHPQPAVEAAFGRYPSLRTARADARGFSHDGSLEQLVRTTLDQIGRG